MKRFLYFLALGLLLVALGIYIWANPTTFINLVTILLGIYLIFDGLKTFYLLFKISQDSKKAGLKKANGELAKGIKITMVVKALLNIIIGILGLVIVATSQDAVVKIIMIVIGVDFIVSGIIDLVEYFSFKAKGFDSGSVLVEGIVGIALGILFCIFPEIIGETALRIVSIVVMMIGVISVCHAIYSLVLANQLKKYGINPAKKKIQDAKFEEVDSSDADSNNDANN